MSKISQNERVTQDRQLMAGIVKHFGKGDLIVAGGKEYKPPEMLAMLKERLDVTEPVFPAKAAWMACVKEQDRVLAATDSVVLELVAFLRLRHGGDVKTLADFGLAPKKRQELTPEQKVARAEKARKTRALRHAKPAQPNDPPATPTK